MIVDTSIAFFALRRQERKGKKTGKEKNERIRNVGHLEPDNSHDNYTTYTPYTVHCG
jgi:hypothetical protein